MWKLCCSYLTYKEDLKSELHFQVKQFLFSFIPGEWSFSHPVQDKDDPLVIDITSDCTGEPHHRAKENMPMYVNETGHDTSLTQNVDALEDSSSLSYYITVSEPMQRNETRELLVNYGQAYEPSRVRNGYGWENLEGNEKSDQNDSSRLSRNMYERDDLLADIGETSLADFYLLVEFCYEISRPLHAIANEYLDDCFENSSNRMSTKQLVALRRMDWLSESLRRRMEDFDLKEDSFDPAQRIAQESFLEQSQSYLEVLVWGRWGELLSLLCFSPDTQDNEGKNMLNEIQIEAVEEFVFYGRLQLLQPLDTSKWCSCVIKLTVQLCFQAAFHLWTEDRREKELLHEFYTMAARVSTAIRQGASHWDLAFDTHGFKDRFVAVADGSKELQSNWLIVTKSTFPDDQVSESTSILYGNAQGITNECDPINCEWYVCRQVVFLLDALGKSIPGCKSHYSLQGLCESVQVPFPVAKVALSGGLDRSETKMGKPPKSASRKKRRREFFWNIVWNCLEANCGWYLERGSREGDFHAFPPGVSRGGGFRSRIHFFDSVKQSKSTEEFIL